MDRSIRIGQIAGVPVAVNWSVLPTFGLVAWNLAVVELPDNAPGHPPGLYWLAATLTASAFFGCLLGHELGHAVVARRRGLPVDGITLWCARGGLVAGTPCS